MSITMRLRRRDNTHPTNGWTEKNIKLQHWRGFPAVFACEGAPNGDLDVRCTVTRLLLCRFANRLQGGVR